jgi:CBS domain-containing protein/gamma-glutamyl:cysteine ligase YbdK (ATP-grasp superfamily)
MGTHELFAVRNESEIRRFTRALIADMSALDQMIKMDLFEKGVRRIGAEQEIFLIDPEMRPSPIASRVLSLLKNHHYTTELGKFNLELNATPQNLSENCFSKLHGELAELLTAARKAAHTFGSDILLTGILPTLRPTDLSLKNMTDVPRYYLLNGSLMDMRGEEFVVHIKGVDELVLSHNSMMMEACNTSFQIHYQVEPSNFVNIYNLAQALSAPLLAAAVNSPLLFQKRLWKETRLALFQHSVDERNPMEVQRFRPTRTMFGEDWIHESILEIYKENVARFRTLLTSDPEEHPGNALAEGRIPRLSALAIHNGTVWRWNRPCYGLLDGRPHLRVENRVLPSGPTLIDEIANAAFFSGMLAGMEKEYPPIDTLINFYQVKENFFTAARHGLNAQFVWTRGKSIPADELILHELLPVAREGLKICNVTQTDIDLYLEIIEQRVRSGKTGARWILDSWNNMRADLLPEPCSRNLTERMLHEQKTENPVHLWEPACVLPSIWREENYRYVGQIMSTDLFTIHPEDLTDLAACIMDWQRIRHLPVEDRTGRLVGLLTQRDLLQFFSRSGGMELVPVQMIMKREPFTVSPDTPTVFAMELMRMKGIGCLPVVENEHLVGIVTTYDLLAVSSKLMEDNLKKSEHNEVRGTA